MSSFTFETNLVVTGGKYFIKIIFDLKIEICIFKTLTVPSLNKVFAALAGGNYLIKIVFDFKLRSGYPKYQMC